MVGDGEREWPAPVRAALAICMTVPTPAAVVYRERVFANQAFGPIDTIDTIAALPETLRAALAPLLADPSWTASGSAPLAHFGVARPVLGDDGALLAIALLEDRAAFAHRLHQPLGPMLVSLDLLKLTAPSEHVDVLERQLRAFAALLQGEHGDSAAPEHPRPTAAVAGSKRILVVEDDDPTARALHGALVELGHDVAVAHDAAIALALAREHAPELVLMDIGLPVVDGWEVAARLRTLGIPALRFVAISGRTADEDRARSAASGFDDHVAKPLGLDRLIQIVGRSA